VIGPRRYHCRLESRYKPYCGYVNNGAKKRPETFTIILAANFRPLTGQPTTPSQSCRRMNLIKSIGKTTDSRCWENLSKQDVRVKCNSNTYGRIFEFGVRGLNKSEKTIMFLNYVCFYLLTISHGFGTFTLCPFESALKFLLLSLFIL